MSKSKNKGRHIAPEDAPSPKQMKKLKKAIFGYWDKEAECTASKHRVISLFDWDMATHEEHIVMLQVAIATDTHLMINPTLPPGRTMEAGDMLDLVRKAGFDSIDQAKEAFIKDMKQQQKSREQRIEEMVAELHEQLESGMAQAALFGEGHAKSDSGIEVHVIQGQGKDSLMEALGRLTKEMNESKEEEE